MLVEAYWEDAEKSVLRVTFTADWNEDAFLAACAEARRLAASVNHPIQLLIDMRRVRKLSGTALHDICGLFQPNSLGNLEHVIVLGGNLLIKTAFDLYCRRHGTPVPVDFVVALDRMNPQLKPALPSI
jgi:hypothetical protein